jgi:hydrogenase nickel incorporation protein HypB
MCATCGCDARTHRHAHAHARPYAPERRTIQLERDVLTKNARVAAQNRSWLAERGLTAVNLMSSPGAGKTTLLEETVRELRGACVIEGDQETDRDAARLREAGARAVQINTGTGCHLDAEMVARGLTALAPPPGGLVLIENVGNLVCPALFDLGERARVVVASVTEGDDKPIKYPHMFRSAQLVLLNKIDLLPHVRFDVDAFVVYARRVQPELACLPVSATRGDGMPAWFAWLRAHLAETVREAAPP